MYESTVSPSERLFSPQVVCVWTSGVYIARAMLGAHIPTDKAEVLALAADSGVPDGSSGNYAKLAVGMKKRYGLTGISYPSSDIPAMRAAVLAAAQAGPCAVAVAGDQYNLVPHWQSGHVGHSIAVIYQNGTTGIQLDPLAPSGYTGDPFPPTELTKYGTAALIFKEEPQMPSFKNAGALPIGKFTFSGAGHALVSPANPSVHYPQAAGSTFDVYATLDLKTADGKSIDIDGNTPALNHRDQVYLVDMPAFGVAAYALRQDGTFMPTPVITPAQLDSAKAVARAGGISDAAKAAAAVK